MLQYFYHISLNMKINYNPIVSFDALRPAVEKVSYKMKNFET
jgi:hypothetical protein